MADFKLCSIPNCSKPAAHKGWCKAHYTRWHRHGDPLGGSTSKGALPDFLHNTVMPYQGQDCLTWPYTRDRTGYGRIRINKKSLSVSRLVCEHVHGPAPTNTHEAAHSCGNGHLGCVTPSHLSWKTPAENQADRIAHGTHQFGEKNARNKLTEKQVQKIRSLKGIITQVEIARIFGISFVTVSDIHNRRRWVSPD